MSNRGGGGRGGGGGVGRNPPQRGGRGGGRGRGFVPPVTPVAPASISSLSPSAPPYQAATESSTAVSTLASNLQSNLSLEPKAPTPTPVPVPSPAPATQSPSSAKALKYPCRPGQGTIGLKCVVRANHFLVRLQEKDLHHYDVSITPEVTSRGVNRMVMRELGNLYHESHMGRLKPVYDGRKSLFTAGALPFASKDFVVKLPEKEGRSARNADREFKVSIKFAAKGDLHHLRQFLQGRQAENPQEIIQILDVVLRETPSNRYTVVGRSFFDAKLGQKTEVGDGLECWRGYYQSLRPTQMGMSLNIDVAATSFYEEISIVEFVKKSLGLRDPSRPLSDADRVKVKKALRGIKVQLSHRQEVRRHKITGITSQPTRQLTFPVDDAGERKNVVQYFQEKYQIRLQYAHWPALQAGSDARPIYLPMEVCTIVGGQRYSKKLNEKQVTAILRAACQRPKERQTSIERMVEYNKYQEDAYAKEFGIQIENSLTTIPGARVLPPPVLKYHDTGKDIKIQPRVGQWNMINAKMVNGGNVQHWAFVNFSRLPPDTATGFCKSLVSMCSNKGMTFSQAPLVCFDSVHPNHIEKALIDIDEQSTKRLGGKGKLQLLIIILPDFTGTYGKIKRVCETELGIISQCCQPRQAQKCNPQYLENVALKINVKAGGRNTVLVDAIQRKIPLVSDLPTIIFGADVTHPPPGEDSCPSIAAVVASMDWPEVTKYRGLVSAQSHRQELIEDLYKLVQDPQKGPMHAGLIRELLISFRRSTGHKPHRIIFYRDGVSEGQFSQVLLHELDAIRKACTSLEADYLPPVTFVVVQKRHHTRLFPADHNNRNMTDKSGNILPGTVVDTMICHPSEFDFYLCSHSGIQGTSRPTHYHVLWDENKFTADQLQMLTNSLCYTYARCTRSVSIVPPAYYAHLAAFRARYYIEGEMTDGTSGTADGRGTRERSGAVRPLPQIKDNVKDVMFYC